MKNIPRPFYLKKIHPFIRQNIIKVLVGQRRVGKSYLLRQIMDEVKKRYPDCTVISINKELNEFDFIKDYKDLIDFVEDRADTSKTTFLFIDEIQEIRAFEKALRHFMAKEIYDIYCTGSNALLLSGELSTFLSGRYVEIKVFGLSYEEFLHFHNLKNDRQSIINYIHWGALPFLINLPKDKETIYEYLRNILITITYKDIVKRYNIRNTYFLENLIKYIANNVGNIISAKKISDYLKSQKLNISPQVVLTYLGYLQSSFLLFKVKRANITGKKIFEIGDKFYFEDWGIRNAVIGFSQMNIQQIIENIVFLHLKTQGFEVFVGKAGAKEIDFIAEKQNRRIYIQTAYLINDEETRKREFGNLKNIKDHWPKMVVSMNEFSLGNYDGIPHILLNDFLLNQF